MKNKNYIVYILFLLIVKQNIAQVVIEKTVIGSTGSYQVGPNVTLSSTIGEVAIQTLFSTSKILTQGFQQPQTISDSIVTYEIINESCRGAKNGSIFISNVVGCAGPYQIMITAVDDSLTILEPNKLPIGIYNVKIEGNTNCSISIKLRVGLDNESNCVLKFYSGITPNNDGKNDVWEIDNIKLFATNEVKIYNRWGEQVWSGKNYDNETVVFNGSTESGEDLGSATYFYVANIENKIYKGWIEITR